jgi:hypothetical protein
MKIKFRQTGGFAGLTKSANIDADQLPDNETGMLRTWIEQANFWSMPKPSSGRSLPDQEQYSITIEADGRSRTLHMSYSSVPTELKPLVDFLRSKATYDKRG